MLFVAVLFIASAVTSCQEVRYGIFGKEAVATITDAKEIMNTGRYGSSRAPASQMLTYTFLDTDGTKRVEKDSVSIDFVPTLQDAAGRPAIDIQFIPGSLEVSRIPGPGRWYFIGLFCAASIAMVFVSVRFYKNYQAHERRKARSFGR
jgi:hypothetical protein